MAVITNLNTQQTPLSASGLTGTQSIKFIDGPRMYIKAVDTTPTPVAVKSNGTLPSGWTDMGIVNGKAKVTYTKDVKEVRTGMDEVLRATYCGKKTAGFDLLLSQFDDVIIGQLSGLTASMITSGSIYQYGIGAEDIVQKALLLVLQNKLDGKEVQFYSPDAFISFGIEDSNNETVVRCKGDLPMFTFGGVQVIFVQSHFA